MQKTWSLYNKEELLRIDDLKPEHVRIILLAIPNSQMNDWFACQEGDLRWQPIGAIAEFYEDVRQLKGRHKESPPLQETPVQEPAPRRPLFEDAPGDPTHTTLVVEKSTTSERRTARRYDRSFHFRVRAGEGKYFATRTSDVSMTGLSLQDSLPTWIQKKFRAELAHNQGSIEIICERISDTQLKIEETANWEALRAWIVSW